MYSVEYSNCESPWVTLKFEGYFSTLKLFSFVVKIAFSLHRTSQNEFTHKRCKSYVAYNLNTIQTKRLLNVTRNHTR